MAVMEKLRMFVAQEPVVAVSCLMAGVGLFLPAVVRPMLDSWESSKQVPPPALNDVSFHAFISVLSLTSFAIFYLPLFYMSFQI
ncbi:hypothetical protein AQUCO_03700181v1 [Aquilegia coerulea]|uniref:Fiber protein Fb11 n=1 Tax=Aquilegia coerulea TaxID=218851 RepID=A0A2G5CTY5_AQUCA|nr:hypothetical protein AQUCO_03700181v1 [Aquilegia coerulea]